MQGVYKRQNNSLRSLCVSVFAGISGSLESIPGLLKRLQIRAQATLASGIGFLESIPRLHNMKNEDEENFFGSKQIYSSLNYQRDEE